MGLFRRKKKKEIYIIKFIFEYNPKQIITEIVHGEDVADAWKYLRNKYHAHMMSLVSVQPFNGFEEYD